MNSLAKNIFLLFFFGAHFLLTSQVKEDSAYVESVLERSRLLEVDNLDSAKVLAEKGLLVSKRISYSEGSSKAFVRFANQLYIIGKYDSAKILIERALELSRKLPGRTTEGVAYRILGSVYEAMGKKDSAFYSLFYALKLFERNHDSLNLGKVYNVLAEVSLNYNETASALDYLNKAEIILTGINNVSTLALTYQIFGGIYYRKNDFEKAIHYLLKAKTANETLGNARYLADNWNLLGLCYEAMDSDGPARTGFGNALKYYMLHNLKDAAGETYFNIGVFFYNRDKNDSAVYYFEKALVLLEDSGNSKVKLQVLPLLSETYAVKGDYQKAYAIHVEYTTLNDSLLNKEKVKQIAEMRARYETEKQAQQIVLLNEQHRSKLAQRNFFIAGSIVLLLSLFVLGFYYRQRGRIADKNEQIAREKISGLLKEQEIKSYDAMIEGQDEERKRIATDLHDRLGSMLSTVKILFGTLNEKIDVNQAENQKQYSKASSLLDEAVLEVRRIAQNLSTGMVITFGLVPALEELCESISESKILKCKFLCYGIEERMEQHIEIGIFRMMQEIVNNVLKHAKAKELIIQMNRTGDSITVTVEDDGVGFNVQEKKSGMGLKNLETRAFKMGGTYNVDSKPGRGTISIIEIPLTHDKDLNS